MRIYARGGAGGQGSKRLGGHGGKGGDVVAIACNGASLAELSRLISRRFVAGNGGNSTKAKVFGSDGINVNICVPPGTVVTNERGQQVGTKCLRISAMTVSTG